ncbi:metal-dependent hydrolase [Desmospora profundinema]|uniref:Inner membrane protein n=1 Tax=Desmospora profundinema TaxID=1571184 RepID=A0ABU1IP97_9BACL|nr:metal-dependent hydrolase [Desmospora profundinema]MDR6226568.1 inner membrane protein [Desmospora profundinema]
MGNTHLCLGVAAGAAAVAITGTADDVATVSGIMLVSSLGALLPDIDEEGSILNNLIFKAIKFRSFALAMGGAVVVLLSLFKNLESWIILSGLYAIAVAFVPHRNFTHSLLSLVIVTWITYLADPVYAWAMALGVISHLGADACTYRGIPLFWPVKKRIGLRSVGVYVRSGDATDRLTGQIAMYSGCFLLLVLLFQDVSYEMFMATTQERLNAVKSLFGISG